MMRPTQAHYFFAKTWPLTLLQTACSLAAAAVSVCVCQPSLEIFTDTSAALGLLSVGALGALLGWQVAILAGWFVLGPIYRDRALKNGAPFQPGDRVRILVGPHRDHVARVYALWQGPSVRVDVGEKEKKNLKDIFAPTELLREPTDEQPSAEENP